MFSKDDEEDFGTGKFAKYQKMMWDLIEKPDTSRAAQVILVLSTIFVSVSIVGMTISTLPSLQYEVNGQTIDNPSLAMVETVCIAWFTLEYFIRLAGAPAKCNFLKVARRLQIISISISMKKPYYLTVN